MKLRIGSRESRLAVIQSEIVIEALQRLHPGLELELVTMKTTGDLILDKTLDRVGGKGLFVKELDRALLDRRVDLTVHSLKDMPMELHPELPLVAVSAREDPRDVLVLPVGTNRIDFTKPLGCSSARRTLQLQKLYPGCRILPVRGNVLTRLERLDRGEFSALVLAYAGLKRLGLTHRVSRIFSIEEILPAAGQGILAVQSRQDFEPSFLEGFHDPDAACAARAERSFVRTLNGGCSSPVAAYAELEHGQLTLWGLLPGSGCSYRVSALSGNPEDAELLGIQLATRMKKEGD